MNGRSFIDSNVATIREFLVPRGMFIACAESVTTGYLQSMLAAVSGASDFFAGGITAYNIQQKVRHLGIQREHALRCNCVSKQVVCEMADGACAMFQTDFAMATTGYAEPYAAAQPFAFAALVSRRGAEMWQRILAPEENLGRIGIQKHFAARTLQWVAELINAGLLSSNWQSSDSGASARATPRICAKPPTANW